MPVSLITNEQEQNNTINENEFKLAAKQDVVEKVYVMEVDNGFYLIIYLKWSQEKQWYLVPRRNRLTPRIFKDLTRLNEFLKSICGTVGFELIRFKQNESTTDITPEIEPI